MISSNRKILTFIFSTLSFFICSNSMAKDQLYSNKEHGFSIEVPSDWKKIEKKYGEVVAVFTAIEAGKDNFRETAVVNVIPEQVDKKIFYHTYIAAEKANMGMSEFTETSANAIQINALSAVRRVISFTINSNGQKIKELQYFFLKDNTGYLLKFVSTPNEFEQHVNTFDKVANSFLLTR